MCFFFFFKQKTAYEMLRSLVGSEMCIRDSPTPDRNADGNTTSQPLSGVFSSPKGANNSSSFFRGGESPLYKGDFAGTVDVALNVSGIPPVSEDVVIKFFYNIDHPNCCHPAFQFWFHPYFEEDVMELSKKEIDGPHKEGYKEKRFKNSFAIEVGLEDCDDE
eukprot:TRINITY_DN27058_c0_g1_i1.p1 TRINITY_DN27058_c0_g1~~TRINITY_DN27058_c0_g1_i1.p1  ORF type:complete len:162 (-),score=68.29 TRINITY_DN27058_c0_g1_i1:235-720(-)